MVGYRIEKDVLGRVNVPSDAYYGSETERAKEDFQISGLRIHDSFIRNYVMLKRSAAIANMKVGKMDKKKANAILKACDEILSGKLWNQFILDVFQAGAGTSTNMNVNEVIANRAIEILGGKRGNYKMVHPNDDVNMSQSTNDTYHSVIHITTFKNISEKLIPSLDRLEKSLWEKSKQFNEVIKVGRTHLEDAVPMSLGQEFSGYAYAVDVAIERLKTVLIGLRHLPIGGTAIGTGINAPNGYKEFAIAEINKSTKEKFKLSKVIFYDMQDQSTEAFAGAALKNAALVLGKIANDFRLLNSGPLSGFGDITLPALLPGSSIMPGKINPSMPDMMNMVCFQVIGNCDVIEQAAAGGQLELNVFMPVIAFNLLFSIEILSNAASAFAEKCVKGIKANEERLSKRLRMDSSLATALSPYIGYAKASEVARRAYQQNKSVKEVCIEMKLFKKNDLDRILDPKKLAGLK